jgi:ABC-2 type transport system ATP-binding protein
MRTPLEVVPITTTALGKRYGSKWALSDCTLDIPAGVVAALVGPNGAGKTTLLTLTAGLSKPSSGSVRVLGHDPRREPKRVLPHVGFVAQEHPLYRGLTVAETLKFGRKMNAQWDDRQARERIERLGLSLGQRVGKLSGGQQAQVALTLALAKKPELLLLDEPVASLDPIARRDFLHALTDAASESGMTVLLSSHNIADLERVCDYLVILAAGGVQLAGSMEQVLAGHRLIRGPRSDASAYAKRHEIVRERHTEQHSTLLVRGNERVHDSRWEQTEPDLEEIVLAYLDQSSSPRRGNQLAEEVAS